MKHFLLLLLLSLEASGRCANLPHPFKTEVRLLRIERLSTSTKDTACGVELEIGSGEVGWLKTGDKADFWSDNPTICNAASGTVTTVTLLRDCCDANYDWCDKKWNSGGTTKTAAGNRIWNTTGNKTF